ncbi:MAG: TIGR03936 family radical SAM-associated protein [Acidimicrobiia bacterium]|nr:TIGR03936 family radical SAM-associated protein [Acidimicrobiia bacterium]
MRVRLRYTKLGRVRFIGHRDVARVWERAWRKARLPIAYSEGFSPRPKMHFGLALSTGYESWAEYVDIDLPPMPTSSSTRCPGGCRRCCPKASTSRRPPRSTAGRRRSRRRSPAATGGSRSTGRRPGRSRMRWLGCSAPRPSSSIASARAGPCATTSGPTSSRRRPRVRGRRVSSSTPTSERNHGAPAGRAGRRSRPWLAPRACHQAAPMDLVQWRRGGTPPPVDDLGAARRGACVMRRELTYVRPRGQRPLDDQHVRERRGRPRRP